MRDALAVIGALWVLVALAGVMGLLVAKVMRRQERIEREAMRRHVAEPERYGIMRRGAKYRAEVSR